MRKKQTVLPRQKLRAATQNVKKEKKAENSEETNDSTPK